MLPFGSRRSAYHLLCFVSMEGTQQSSKSTPTFPSKVHTYSIETHTLTSGSTNTTAHAVAPMQKHHLGAAHAVVPSSGVKAWQDIVDCMVCPAYHLWPRMQGEVFMACTKPRTALATSGKHWLHEVAALAIPGKDQHIYVTQQQRASGLALHAYAPIWSSDTVALQLQYKK